MPESLEPGATERLAVPAAAIAKMLAVSERHVWQLNSSGRIPQPFRLGRSVRWSVDEIRAWQAAGAPTRDRWEQMKRAGTAGR